MAVSPNHRFLSSENTSSGVASAFTIPTSHSLVRQKLSILGVTSPSSPSFVEDEESEWDQEDEFAGMEAMEDYDDVDVEIEMEGDFLNNDPISIFVPPLEELEEAEAAATASTQPKKKKKSTKPIRRYKSAKKEPLIAILGRPNVGKSALVNRIAGTQSGGAIVADESGITRDRTYRQANFLGEAFQLVDTGGLVFDEDENTLFAKEIRQQANIAIDEASGVILVVDGQTGMTGLDLQIAEFLRKEVLPKGLPVHIAVNKCESETTGALNAAEFWNLGLGEPYPVSALHGVGTAELLETMFDSIVEKKSAAISTFGTKVQRLRDAKLRKNSKKQLPGEDDVEYKMRKYGIGDISEQLEKEYEEALKAFDDEERPEEINVAIIGRPNVGKSSLLNSLFGDTRAIVSDLAGTTRDSIDAMMERPGEDPGDLSTIYRFVDTAGIRRKGKIEFGPEFFMINRALRAIRRSDVGTYLGSLQAGN